jgi:hypothetical protein
MACEIDRHNAATRFSAIGQLSTVRAVHNARIFRLRSILMDPKCQFSRKNSLLH